MLEEKFNENGQEFDDDTIDKYVIGGAAKQKKSKRKVKSKSKSKTLSKSSKKSKEKTIKKTKVKKSQQENELTLIHEYIKSLPHFDQKTIYRKYKDYESISLHANGKMEDFCFPKEFTLTPPQKFLGAWMKDLIHSSLLVVHEIGAGKTCGGIQISLDFLELNDKIRGNQTRYTLISVMPASLIGGYRSELMSSCTGERYLTNKERELLKNLVPGSIEYKEIIERANKKIDNEITIFSFEGATKWCSNILKQLENYGYSNENNQTNNNKELDNLLKSLSRTVIIYDEVHNLLSDDGSRAKTFYNFVMKIPKETKIVMMSATPIYDKPSTLGIIINLLHRKEILPRGKRFIRMFIGVKIKNNLPVFNILNKSILKALLNGYVSYYAGAPKYTYPKKKFSYVFCKMSQLQESSYNKLHDKIEYSGLSSQDLDNESDIFGGSPKTKEVKETNNESNDQESIELLNMIEDPNGKLSKSFHIGLRQISNIVYPNGLPNEDGFFMMKDIDWSDEELIKYSPKILFICKFIESCRTVLIHTFFKNYAGAKPLIAALEYRGYKNFILHGKGPKRYAVWSGDEDIKTKELIRSTVNLKENFNGDLIKIIIGTPAVKEGVSFLRFDANIMMGPSWVPSMKSQIFGRIDRYCSHKDVPAKYRVIKLLILVSVFNNSPNVSNVNENNDSDDEEFVMSKNIIPKRKLVSVEENIILRGFDKNLIILKLMKILKESAIDYYLNQETLNS